MILIQISTETMESEVVHRSDPHNDPAILRGFLCLIDWRHTAESGCRAQLVPNPCPKFRLI